MSSENPFDVPERAPFGFASLAEHQRQAARATRIEDSHQARVSRIQKRPARKTNTLRRSARLASSPGANSLGSIRSPRRPKKRLHSSGAMRNHNHGALAALPGDDDLSEAEKLTLLNEKTGYTFKNSDLARAALDMDELSHDHVARKLKSGMGTSCQNLAIVGDLALELAIADKWFEIASTPQTWEAMKRRVTTNVALEDFCLNAELFRCYGGRRSHLTKKWPRATLVEAVLGAVYQDSGKNIAAVQAAMEWLGILQAGMEALETAEVSREAQTARKTHGRSANRRVNGPGRERERKNENGDENKHERILIEISDDDDDMADASIFEDDEDDKESDIRSSRSGNWGVPSSMEIEYHANRGTARGIGFRGVIQDYVERDETTQEEELAVIGGDQSDGEASMDFDWDPDTTVSDD